MEIRLERKLVSCPSRLLCRVCRQGFEARRIRTLLYNGSGLIQGDVCPNCLKLKASGIKQKMKEQSEWLIKQAAELEDSQSIPAHQLAIELLEGSQEDVKLPKFYDWLLKRLEIFSQESQELEAARLGLSNCSCGKRSHLRIVFEDDTELD